MPAAAVRAVLTQPNIGIPKRGIAIRGALFDDCLDLDNVKLDHQLHLSRCVLAGGLSARNAAFRELVLIEVNILGGVQAAGVTVNGRLDLSGTHLNHPEKVALDLHNSKIVGSLLVRGSLDAKGKLSRCFASNGTIRLDGATIGGHLTATTAILVNPADLNQFRAAESGRCSLFFDGICVGGDLIATNNFRSYGEVRGVKAAVGGQVNLTGAKIINVRKKPEPGRRALTLDHADIGTDVFADKGFVAIGAVSAVGVHIGGRLDLNGADFRNPSASDDDLRYALVLDHARIALSVSAGITTTGAISATGITVGDQLSLGGAVLDNPNALGILILDGAKIGGDLWASEDQDAVGNKLAPLDATGEVRALRVSIGGDLNLDGASIDNPEGDALTLDNAQIGRHVFATGGFTANGTVRALGITIGHSLYLDGAQLAKNNYARRAKINALGDDVNTDDRQFALLLDDATITGSMYARYDTNGRTGEPFKAEGAIRALGLTVGRHLDMAGAVLKGPSPAASMNCAQYALQLDHAKIGGDFVGGPSTDTSGRVLGRMVITGAVRAVEATIGGDFVLEAATLVYQPTPADPHGCALDVSGMRITGSLLGSKQDEVYQQPYGGCCITGGIKARNLFVGNRLDLTNAILSGQQKWTLDLESATVSELKLMPKICAGGVNLIRARIIDLHTARVHGLHNSCKDCRDRPLPPHPLKATGWEIDHLQGPVRDDWRIAHDWLNTSFPDKPSKNPQACWTAWPRRKPSIAVQPWYTVASVYDRIGDPAAARRVRYKADARVTAQSPIGTRLTRTAYRIVAGYGLYPLWSILSMATLVLLATLAVCMSRADIVPTNPPTNAAMRPQQTTVQPPPFTAQTPCEKHPEYPCMQPLIFAINSVLPPAAGTNTQWTLSSTAPLALVIILTAIKLALWATAALFLAGVTGLLRSSKT